MPREIKSREEFEKLLPSATEIRVVYGRGPSAKGSKEKGEPVEASEDSTQTKIKIRTGNQLYTFKTTEEDVKVLLKQTKAPVVEY